MITIANIFCHGLLKKNNKLLVLKRGNNRVYPYVWDLPGGRKEENESFKECVIREFKEETGLNIKVNELIDVKTQIYNNEIIVVLIYEVTSTSYSIKLNREHIKYEFVDSLDNKTLIWYLRKN